MAAVPNNLPLQVTRFVGRERELAEVKRVLTEASSESRLLTLTGAGGCGKTRLALRVAEDSLSVYPDGVWGATRWVVVHWAAAAALSLFAVAGLVVLAAASRLTQGWWTTTAWAVLPLGALWTLTTAVAEATAVSGAAVSGNTAMFEAWWAFAEGKATGFIFLALAVAVIAGNETRISRATPVWASWMAVVAGVASFAGWVLGMWLDIAPGNLVWVLDWLLEQVSEQHYYTTPTRANLSRFQPLSFHTNRAHPLLRS